MKTLILYATKHGAAGRCAAMLKEKISGEVHVHNLKERTSFDLAGYDKVVIGGSIYAGRVQKEVREFCTQNLNSLKDKTLGFYICCMFQDSAAVQINNAFPQELLNNAAARESFGGEMIFSDMNFFEKTLTKMVSKTLDKKGSGHVKINTKQDASMLISENIDRFAQQMNKA